MSNKSYLRLRDTVIDGRAANVFYRKQQLRSLNNELLAARDELLEAIVSDSVHTEAEAWVEFYLAISSLKAYFDALNPENVLAEENAIARGENAECAREAVGIAYVEPTAHTMVYSVVVAVCAAIASGNCVAVVIEQTLRKRPVILQKVLRKALDPDLVDITPTRIEDSEFRNSCVQVLQDSETSNMGAGVLLSASKLLTIAIVDRSANMEEAAKNIVNARFRFCGTSPYAPDLVLVNEFVKTDFLNAAVRHSITYLTEERGEAIDEKRLSREPQQKAFEDNEGFKLVTSGSNGAIFEVTKFTRTALPRLEKVTRRALYVHSVSSMDDAINIANSLANPKLLAAFAFGSLETSKYMIQFVGSHIAFANHIPTQLLVGPAIPLTVGASVTSRYPIEAFTIPRPIYAMKPATAADLEALLSEPATVTKQQKSKMLQQLHFGKDRPVRHYIGFFEQGIITGLTIMVTPILIGISAMGYYGVSRFLLPLLRH